MSSVVFILGAGASHQCGAPVMGDFLDVASDLARSRQVNDDHEAFETVFRVIGGLQRVHSKAQLDLTNIESIFTALELGKVIQRVPGLNKEDIPSAISALKTLIVRTLDQTIEFPTKGTSIHAPAPYADFADLVQRIRTHSEGSHTVSVVTFNYDVAVDLALFRAGLGPDYVIEGPSNVRDPIELMKLHGSLNWATVASPEKQIRPLHFNNYFQHYSIQHPGQVPRAKLTFRQHLQEYFQNKEGLKVDTEPVIVPPSWNKSDYHSALSKVWSRAAQHLEQAQHIFVIGYSLPETDSFFRHLYALGSVGDHPLRNFIVYNPDPNGGVDRRFKTLLGPGAASRYKYVQTGFSSAFQHINGIFPKRA